MSKLLNETSKFLSFILRHEPQSIGLTLDTEGWADISALIDGANKRTLLKSLQLKFEAVSQISEENRRVIQSLIDGMILKHTASQLMAG